MSNFTVEIKAPEVCKSIDNLCALLVELIKRPGATMAEVKPVAEQVFNQLPTPTQQPVQQQPAYVAPVQQPMYANPVLQQAPVQTVTPPVQQAAPPIQQAPPTVVQTYSLDQLAVAGTQLADQGKRNELIALLNGFGVQALTALPKEQYGAFATQLRAMGAKI